MQVVTMINKFKRYLTSKNIPFDPINDTLIGFEAEQLNMMFATDVNDKSYVRVLVPRIDEPKNLKPEDWEQIAVLNSDYKAAKIVKVDDELWIACEVFIYSSELTEFVFNRMILACKTIYEAYVGFRNNKRCI